MDFTCKILITLLLLVNITLVSAKEDQPRNKKISDPQIEQIRDPDAQYGKTILIKQKKAHLRVNGPVQISLSEISGLTKLNGPADIKNSIFNNLEHHGTLNCFDTQVNNAKLTGVVNLTRTKIFKKLNLVGTITAQNSIIDEIVATTAKIVLDNCIVHNITITGDINYPNHQPIVELRGATTISGTIKFVEADGNVQVFGTNISYNKLENGIVSNF